MESVEQIDLRVPLSTLWRGMEWSGGGLLPPMCQYGITSGQELASGSSNLREHWPKYADDLLEMLSHLPPGYMETPFLIRFGDCVDPAPFPLLSKARTSGDENAILLPLNVERHFGLLFQALLADGAPEYDYPFWDKVPKVFWRGTTTDHGWDPSMCVPNNHRRSLVEAWASSNDSRVDVGLYKLVQEANATDARSHWQQYQREFKPSSDQLMYRYFVAPEGNDVATSLKWMLASNSVVLMPDPRRETWILESQLTPWQHYVPVRHDFADLLDKVEWCEQHLTECAAITERATAQIRKYGNRTEILKEGAMILRNYLDQVNTKVAYG